MEKIKLEILGLSSSSAQTNSILLVLGEKGGGRQLPITIGIFEAQAIAIVLENIKPNRPMTHDLFLSFSTAFNYMIESVTIYDLKEGIFFARIGCSDGLKTIEIDARPSDAVAIALRFGVAICTTEHILSEAGISMSEQSIEETGDSPIISQTKTWEEEIKEMPLDRLEMLLEAALQAEDYEKAATIRDEINRRS